MKRNYYYLYDAAHAVMGPARAISDMTRLYFKNPINPLSHTMYGKSVAAACEMFERSTRRYGKPEFNLGRTEINGRSVAVSEQVVWSRPFCRLIRFTRALPPRTPRQPRLLIVAPMSGHYATLLRGTVEAFLPTHEVFITDWVDARLVSLSEGRFGLGDYIDYMIDILHELGPETHVLAVCQPAVPVAAAVALMEAADDPDVPRSMILMGGPIDTRKSPTAVNRLAEERGIKWFEDNCIVTVPFPHPGVMRAVYPGFLQLSGFMAMNIDRHVEAHLEMFQHLVKGDGDSAEKQREFYDEYLAVMDMTAEFYLETVDQVFVRHTLPKGEMVHRGKTVDLARIRNVALMTVEGENDDISGIGQTKATHDLCVNLPKDMQLYHLQLGVGHYGVFNGSRFRREIAPAITAFTYQHNVRHTGASATGANVVPLRASQAPEVTAPKPAASKPHGSKPHAPEAAAPEAPVAKPATDKAAAPKTPAAKTSAPKMPASKPATAARKRRPQAS
jgi:poly(3-hydroxybutyrate) depolymerase